MFIPLYGMDGKFHFVKNKGMYLTAGRCNATGIKCQRREATIYVRSIYLAATFTEPPVQRWHSLFAPLELFSGEPWLEISLF
jgi:hypothetical protein